MRRYNKVVWNLITMGVPARSATFIYNLLKDLGISDEVFIDTFRVHKLARAIRIQDGKDEIMYEENSTLMDKLLRSGLDYREAEILYSVLKDLRVNEEDFETYWWVERLTREIFKNI